LQVSTQAANHSGPDFSGEGQKRLGESMILPVTLTIAGAAAIVNLWLAVRVAGIRVKGKVLIGDGGNTALITRMRAHSNYVEYAPFVLILMGLIEYSGGSPNWLWGLGIAFIAGRVLHPFGMDKGTPNLLRASGILITFAVMIGLAGWAISVPYTHGAVVAVPDDSLGGPGR
jgi:uncharacterized membrane protein YecN with MAPEG domain